MLGEFLRILSIMLIKKTRRSDCNRRFKAELFVFDFQWHYPLNSISMAFLKWQLSLKSALSRAFLWVQKILALGSILNWSFEFLLYFISFADEKFYRLDLRQLIWFDFHQWLELFLRQERLQFWHLEPLIAFLTWYRKLHLTFHLRTEILPGGRKYHPDVLPSRKVEGGVGIWSSRIEI